MITVYHQGDLLNAFELNEFDAIVHGCNCYHTMGAGIAGAIAKRFPIAFEVDQKTNYGDWEKLGKYSVAEHANGSIINAYTQWKPGKELRERLYENIENVFKAINNDFKGQKIGIPMIGCGIAGGEWSMVSEIINRVTPDVNLVCYYF